MDGPTVPNPKDAAESGVEGELKKLSRDATILYPPQWVQCDLRYLDMTVLGTLLVLFLHTSKGHLLSLFPK